MLPLAKEDILFFVDDTITHLEYAEGHVMRPVRLRVLHSLLLSLGLQKHLTICQTHKATRADLLQFHIPEYLDFLEKAADICATPLDTHHLQLQQQFKASVSADADCPLFPEVWDVVLSSCGATIAGAKALNAGMAKVAVNFAGGMHHATAASASGFCYANDVVLGIMELLKRFQRVLYVDVDAHHGDGVEDAFATNRRVFTLSFHQFGSGFFPGTGSLDHIGEGVGRGFAVNIPLAPKTADSLFTGLFACVVQEIVRAFQPEAVVMQSGADCVFGDVIGGIHLSSHAHAFCVDVVVKLGLPLLVVGGGGYNVFHTAKTWALVVAVICGKLNDIPQLIPTCDPYYGYYRQEEPARLPTLHVEAPLEPPSRKVAFLSAISSRIAAQMKEVREWRLRTFPPTRKRSRDKQ